MRGILYGLLGGLWCVAMPGMGQERVLDVSVDADVKALLPGGAAQATGVAGRGGLKVTATTGPNDEGPATRVGGAVNGSLYPDANYGDLLLPGSGYHGFALEPGLLGRPCILEYDIYLSAGHRVRFVSLSTRFMADVDGNQIIKYDGPGNEFADRVETFAAVKGPNFNVVDQWQTVSATAVLPANDKAGHAIGQFNLSLNIGQAGAPGAKVWVRNIRLTMADDPSAGGADSSAEEPPAPPEEGAPEEVVPEETPPEEPPEPE